MAFKVAKPPWPAAATTLSPSLSAMELEVKALSLLREGQIPPQASA